MRGHDLIKVYGKLYDACLKNVIGQPTVYIVKQLQDMSCMLAQGKSASITENLVLFEGYDAV